MAESNVRTSKYVCLLKYLVNLQPDLLLGAHALVDNKGHASLPSFPPPPLIIVLWQKDGDYVARR